MVRSTVTVDVRRSTLTCVDDLIAIQERHWPSDCVLAFESWQRDAFYVVVREYYRSSERPGLASYYVDGEDEMFNGVKMTVT